MAATTNGSVSMQTDFDKLGDGANINLRNFNKENHKAQLSGQSIFPQWCRWGKGTERAAAFLKRTQDLQ